MSTAKQRRAAPKPEVRTPFKEMTPNQKLVRVLQITVCLCTFGFVFPNSIGSNDPQV